MNPLARKRIVLGVSGSIAAYKAADLASKLFQAGATVDVILTSCAENFLTPLTFQSLIGRKAYCWKDLWGEEGHVIHVQLAQRADALVLAPATAHSLARLAHGMADDLFCLTVLSARCPLLIAPAMDAGMWEHPSVQANVRSLKERGVHFIGPEIGHLASGLEATGRMSEPAAILNHVRFLLSRNGPLQGRRVLVTAGGTREPIDPVREIANRSSGKQGFAVAQAALDAGAEVVLIAGPTSLPTPSGARRVDVRTTEEMKSAVLRLIEEEAVDILIMAAAPADFRPICRAANKIKKEEGIPEVKLERTPDILLEVAAYRRRSGKPQVVVGFAAETENPLPHALSKLRAKDLSFIVANRVDAPGIGFETDANKVMLVEPEKDPVELPLLSKYSIAEEIISKAFSLLQ